MTKNYYEEAKTIREARRIMRSPEVKDRMGRHDHMGDDGSDAYCWSCIASYFITDADMADALEGASEFPITIRVRS